MFNLKTHYEQVPLEIVRKDCMDEQLRAETTNARYSGDRPRNADRGPLSKRKSDPIAQSLTLGERAS